MLSLAYNLGSRRALKEAGWWDAREGVVIGDEPSDILGDAHEAVVEAYLREQGRLPTAQEMQESWRFVTGVHGSKMPQHDLATRMHAEDKGLDVHKQASLYRTRGPAAAGGAAASMGPLPSLVAGGVVGGVADRA